MTNREINELIVSCLSNDLLSPKLLKRKLASKSPNAKAKTWGHCYIASEAVFHLYAWKEGFKPYHYLRNNNTHWYLMRDADGPAFNTRYQRRFLAGVPSHARPPGDREVDVIDLTFAQFTTWWPSHQSGNQNQLWYSPISYEHGTPCGFLTKEPSKRAKTLIGRVLAKMKEAE
jgi:hypothetical protein